MNPMGVAEKKHATGNMEWSGRLPCKRTVSLKGESHVYGYPILDVKGTAGSRILVIPGHSRVKSWI
jgi:hypothetical protein